MNGVKTVDLYHSHTINRAVPVHNILKFYTLLANNATPINLLKGNAKLLNLFTVELYISCRLLVAVNKYNRYK